MKTDINTGINNLLIDFIIICNGFLVQVVATPWNIIRVKYPT